MICIVAMILIDIGVIAFMAKGSGFIRVTSTAWALAMMVIVQFVVLWGYYVAGVGCDLPQRSEPKWPSGRGAAGPLGTLADGWIPPFFIVIKKKHSALFLSSAEVRVRRRSLPYVVLFAAAIGAPPPVHAQGATPGLGKDEIALLAKVQVAIGVAHDSTDRQLAMVGNKKPEVQQALKDKLRSQIAEILRRNGMTEEQYKRETFIISTDTAARRSFDGDIVQLTGAPLPGGYVAPPAGAGGRGGRGGATTPPIAVPAGAAGTHIGHVVNSFGDTPNGMGLLPAAFAEARTALQHATLAQKAATLDAMKLHAGHVINAMDPTIVAAGPGLGYGMKKAALGVAAHIELASKAAGASQNVIMHSVHIATSARNAAAKADQIIDLATKVQATTTMPEAAALLSRIVSLCDQVIAGVDEKGDGRVTWQTGGLQQAQEHVNLLLAAER